MTTTGSNREKLVRDYIQAVASQDYAKIDRLLAPDVQFRGPAMTRSTSQELIAALQRLGAIHVRSDVRRVFVDGDDACVIYDFVTDTTAGALPTIEWLRFAGDRIQAIDLYYDRVPWQATVMPAIAERAAGTAARPVA